MTPTQTRTTRRQPREAATWRAQLAALRYVPKFIQLIWQTHRGYTVAMAVLRLCRAFIPLATLWVGKLIIDAVVDMREAPADFSRLWPLVALEIVIVLVGEMLARASVLVESLLGELFSTSTSMRVMQHAATLDLYHFEDPTFYDRLERARRQTSNRIGLLAQLLTMGQDVLTLMSLGTALLRVQSMVAADPGRRRPAKLPRRDALRRARICARLPLDAGAAAARLSALRRRQRRDDQGSPTVRTRALAGRALPSTLGAPLRGAQAVVDPQGQSLDRAVDPGDAGLLRRLSHHPCACRRGSHYARLTDLSCGIVRALP